jgi:hypothetical protein
LKTRNSRLWRVLSWATSLCFKLPSSSRVWTKWWLLVHKTQKWMLLNKATLTWMNLEIPLPLQSNSKRICRVLTTLQASTHLTSIMLRDQVLRVNRIWTKINRVLPQQIFWRLYAVPWSQRDLTLVWNALPMQVPSKSSAWICLVMQISRTSPIRISLTTQTILLSTTRACSRCLYFHLLPRRNRHLSPTSRYSKWVRGNCVAEDFSQVLRLIIMKATTRTTWGARTSRESSIVSWRISWKKILL